MRELAPISLCAGTSLVEGTEDGLGVDSKRHLLLNLNRLKQISQFLLLGLFGTLAVNNCLLLTLLLNLLLISFTVD